VDGSTITNGRSKTSEFVISVMNAIVSSGSIGSGVKAKAQRVLDTIGASTPSDDVIKAIRNA
jgi:hypothetical protein